MREGESRTTKNGMVYTKIGGRVRFVGKAGGTRRRRKGGKRARRTSARASTRRRIAEFSPIGAINEIADLGGVSIGELAAFAKGAKKCITVVAPEGVRTVCANIVKGVKRRTSRKRR